MKTHTVTLGMAALLTCAPLGHGASVVGATGNVNSGRLADNSFYRIDLGGKRSPATYLGTASVTPNQLAYDVSTDNLYYTDHNGSWLKNFPWGR